MINRNGKDRHVCVRYVHAVGTVKLPVGKTAWPEKHWTATDPTNADKITNDQSHPHGQNKNNSPKLSLIVYS